MRRRNFSLLLGMMLIGSILQTGSAQAAPTFQMPFPCGERWGASTYSNHDRNGNNNSIDWNLEGYAQDRGRRVEAGVAGTVTVGWQSPGYGNYVTVAVDGAAGWATRYAHLQGVSVSNGQRVSANTQIGTVGSSGLSDSSAYHLHYEQRYNGVPQRATINGSQIGIGTFPNQVIHTSGNCGGSPPAPNTYPTNADAVRVRSAPNTTSSIVATLGGAGTPVHIVCQTTGETINGSNIWDKIDSPANGYVADTFVNTGTSGYVAGIPKCSLPPPPKPVVTEAWIDHHQKAHVTITTDGGDDYTVAASAWCESRGSWLGGGDFSPAGAPTQSAVFPTSCLDGETVNLAAQPHRGTTHYVEQTGYKTAVVPRYFERTDVSVTASGTVTLVVTTDGLDTYRVRAYESCGGDPLSSSGRVVGVASPAGEVTQTLKYATQCGFGEWIHVTAVPISLDGAEQYDRPYNNGTFFDKKSHASAVTLRFAGHLTVFGQITADPVYAGCVSNRTVYLQKKVQTGWKSIARLKSRRDGTFSHTPRDARGRYRMLAKNWSRSAYMDDADGMEQWVTHLCSRATSPSRSHSHA